MKQVLLSSLSIRQRKLELQGVICPRLQKGDSSGFWQIISVFSFSHYHSFIHSCNKHLFSVCQFQALLKPWGFKGEKNSLHFRNLHFIGRDEHVINMINAVIETVQQSSEELERNCLGQNPSSSTHFEQMTYHRCASDTLYMKWR